jgi:hypothetical protein
MRPIGLRCISLRFSAGDASSIAIRAAFVIGKFPTFSQFCPPIMSFADRVDRVTWPWPCASWNPNLLQLRGEGQAHMPTGR